MKQNILLYLIGIMLLASFSFALTDATVYYSFDNADLSGINPLDVSGNLNDGVSFGSLTTGNLFVVKEGFDFDGNDDVVRFAQPFTPNSDFSFALWFKTTTASQTQEIFHTNQINTAGFLRLHVFGSNLRLSTHDGTYIDVDTGFTLSDGVTYHFALNRIQSTGQCELYIDGVFYNSYPCRPATLGVNNDWRLGEGFNNNNVLGSIDEFGLWERVLTAGEVTQLFNGGSGFNPYAPLPPPLVNISTQWFESFEDLDLSNNFTVVDAGDTAWNSTVTSNTFAHHGVGIALNTKGFLLNDASMRLDTELIDATGSINDVDVKFILAILNSSQKFDPDDYLRVYVIPQYAPPVLALEQRLDLIDESNLVDVGQIFEFSTAFERFQLRFELDADHPLEYLLLDNILVEWILTPEDIINNNINITTQFNNTVTVATNVTTFIDNNINFIDNDTFDPFATAWAVVPSKCPLNKGNNDRTFYMFVIAICIILFIFAFWLDNAIIGLLSALMLMYIGFISIACDVFLGAMLILMALVGFLLSLTQLSLTKT